VINSKIKTSPTTKDVALLRQLHQDGQLRLQAEFQRESVWPKSAKSYFIDSVLNDRPVPLFFFERGTSIQTGRPEYSVIDGQQRLRALFEFINDDFSLSEVSPDGAAKSFKGRKFSELPKELQQAILNYDLVIQEVSGYSEDDIRDIFTRMNKYVVRLSKQELRHAKAKGKFKSFVEKLAKSPFWRVQRVFSDSQIRRMRPAEFVAELVILLSEGPQDKKLAVDLYYGRYQKSFPEGVELESRLLSYLNWIADTIPNFPHSRYRRSNELYSLVGALDKIAKSRSELNQIDAAGVAKQLVAFETLTKAPQPRGLASQYLIAASKHTDDLKPRTTRIEILSTLFE
jgi:Protein of unknown function DUF262